MPLSLAVATAKDSGVMGGVAIVVNLREEIQQGSKLRSGGVALNFIDVKESECRK